MATTKDTPLELQEQKGHETSVPATTSPDRFLAMIESASRDPNVDVSKMERLFEMMKQMEAIRAENAFNTAMKLCQQEMPKIVRDGYNDQTRSRYAKTDTMLPVIVPIYTKHGFAISFGTAESKLEEHVRITALVTGHGHTRHYQVDLPYDYKGIQGANNKTKIHGVGSTINYGRRYLTYLIFNIALAGEDNDGNGSKGQQQKGPAAATIQNRKWFINELKKRDLDKKAHQYAIDKAIIMPDKGLEDWPLDKLPIVQSAYETLFETIKNHK